MQKSPVCCIFAMDINNNLNFTIMDETRVIDPANAGGKNKKKNETKARVGAAVAGAGVGSAAMAAAVRHEEEEAVADGGQQQQAAAQPDNNNEAGQEVVTPIGQAGESGEAIVNPENIDSNEAQVVNPSQSGQTAQDSNNGSYTANNPQETVNPGEVADAIIAETQVDPDDVEMPDVVSFDELGTVYTVEGDSYTAATFHDPVGNEMAMIDVDDDGIFDLIIDPTGEPIADAGGLTVSDAEVMITGEENNYLAANDNDNPNLPDGEDVMNDILTV